MAGKSLIGILLPTEKTEMNAQSIKRFALSLLASSMLLAGCTVNGLTFGDFNLNRIVGSGVSKTESRPISGVTAVSSYGNVELIVERGETESLTVTADENILPYLTSDVSGGRLSLGTKYNTSITTFTGIVYRLTVKQLDILEVSGSSSTTVNGIAADRFSVKSTGSGNITVIGKATHQDVTLTGSGRYVADRLDSEIATVHLSGYYGNPTLNVATHGSGRTYHR
jgi:hypothetical protein